MPIVNVPLKKTLEKKRPYLIFGCRLSNSQIAKPSGLHVSAVSRWRSGLRCPDPESALKVADVFNFPTSWVNEWLMIMANRDNEKSADFLRRIFG